MSAICGVIRFDGVCVDRSDLERQIGSLSARGPDRRKVWCDGPVGLGQALLRVTYEDAYDDQPLSDRSAGLTVVADARLDNRDELAEIFQIPDQNLARIPDSALVLRAYKKWGSDCAAHLLGDFTFAIWDASERRLVLGRDHMGARHVYFHPAPGFFAFASEKKGLWALPDVPYQLDDFHIGKALTLDLSNATGSTTFAGIFGLRPATVFTVRADGAQEERRYWWPKPAPVHLGRDEAYYVDTYRRVLAEAVACRVRRNVKPTAMLLSGGFDSSAIAALAGPTMQAHGRKLIAVASVMPKDRAGELPDDPRPWVEACERKMPHLDVVYVTREGFGLLGNLEQHFVRTDTRTSPNRAANNAMFSAAAGRGAVVLIDGHGGDYTLNPRAQAWLTDQLWGGRVWLFFSELRALKCNLRLPWPSMIKHYVIKPSLPRNVWRMWLRFREGSSSKGAIVPLNADFARFIRKKGGHLRLTWPKSARGDRSRFGAFFTYEMGKPHNSMHVAAAEFGLEYVQPFHDKRVVELGFAIPSGLLVRNGYNRHLARTALRDVLPPELLSRTKGDDTRTPDFMEMAERERPHALAEIERMAKDPRLARYFDFEKMRSMLHKPTRGLYGTVPENRVRHAFRTLLMARFIEWTQRQNRIGSIPDCSDDAPSSSPRSGNRQSAGQGSSRP